MSGFAESGKGVATGLGWEVVEPAGDGGCELGVGGEWGGKPDLGSRGGGELGGGVCGEVLREKPKGGLGELAGGLGEVVAVGDEQMGGDEAAAGVAEDGVGGVDGGSVEDDAGEGAVACGEFRGDVRAESVAEDDDAGGVEVAGGSEVVESGLRVVEELSLAGAAGAGELDAVAVAEVVDGEDGGAGAVERGDIVDGVAEVAFCGVEQQDGEAGVGGRDPPGGELGCTVIRGGEVDGLEGERGGGGGARDGSGGVVEELPSALPIEEAEGKPGEYERAGDGDGEGGEEPAGGDGGEGAFGLVVHVFQGLFKGGRAGRFGRFGGWGGLGTGHGLGRSSAQG